MPEENVNLNAIKALLKEEDLNNPELIRKRTPRISLANTGYAGGGESAYAITQLLNIFDDATLNDRIAKRIDNKLSWEAKRYSKETGIPIDEAKKEMVEFAGEGWVQEYEKYKQFYRDLGTLSSEQLEKKYTAKGLRDIFDEFSMDIKEDLGVNSIKPVDKEGIKNFLQATWDSLTPDIVDTEGVGFTLSPQKKADVQDQINKYLKSEDLEPIQFDNSKDFSENLALGLADTLGAMPYYIMAGWATAPLKLAGTFRIFKIANIFKNPLLNKLGKIGAKTYEMVLQGAGYSAAEIARRYDSDADVGELAKTGFKTGVGEAAGRMAFTSLLGKFSYVDNPTTSKALLQHFIQGRIGRSIGSGFGEMIEEEGGNLFEAMGEGRLNKLLNMKDMAVYERLAIEFILGMFLSGSYLKGLDVNEKSSFENMVRKQLGMEKPDLKTFRDVIGEEKAEKYFFDLYNDLHEKKRELIEGAKNVDAKTKEYKLKALRFTNQAIETMELQAGIGAKLKNRFKSKRVAKDLSAEMAKGFNKEEAERIEGILKIEEIGETEEGRKSIKTANEVLKDIKIKLEKPSVTNEDINQVFNRMKNKIKTKDDIGGFVDVMIQYKKGAKGDKRLETFLNKIIGKSIKDFLSNNFEIPEGNNLMREIVDATKNKDLKKFDNIISTLRENFDPQAREELKSANISELYNFLTQTLQAKKNNIGIEQLRKLIEINKIKQGDSSEVKSETEERLRERNIPAIKEPEPVSNPSDKTSKEKFSGKEQITKRKEPEPKLSKEPEVKDKTEEMLENLTPEQKLKQLEFEIKAGAKKEEDHIEELKALREKVKNEKKQPETESKEKKSKPKEKVKKEKKSPEIKEPDGASKKTKTSGVESEVKEVKETTKKEVPEKEVEEEKEVKKPKRSKPKTKQTEEIADERTTEEVEKTTKEKAPKEVEKVKEVVETIKEEVPEEIKKVEEIEETISKTEKVERETVANQDPEKERENPTAENVPDETTKQLTESEKESEVAKSLINLKPKYVNSVNELTYFTYEKTGFYLDPDNVKKEIEALSKKLFDGEINIKKAKKYFADMMMALIGKENAEKLIKSENAKDVKKAFARVFVKNKDKRTLPSFVINIEPTSCEVIENLEKAPDGKNINNYDYTSHLDGILQDMGLDYFYSKGVYEQEERHSKIDYRLLGAVMEERGYFLLSSNADGDTEVWIKIPKEIDHNGKKVNIYKLTPDELIKKLDISKEILKKISATVNEDYRELQERHSELIKTKETSTMFKSLGTRSKTGDSGVKSLMLYTRIFEYKYRKEISEKGNYPFRDANYVKRMQILNARGMRGSDIKSNAKVVKENLFFAYKVNPDNSFETKYISPKEVEKAKKDGYSVKEANDGIVFVHPDKIKEVNDYFEEESNIIKPFGYFENTSNENKMAMVKCSVQPASKKMAKKMEAEGVDTYIYESADKGGTVNSEIGDGKGIFEFDWDNVYIKQFGNKGESEATFTRMIMNYLNPEEADSFISEHVERISEVNNFFAEMRKNTYLANTVWRLIFGAQNVQDIGSDLNLIESGAGIHPILIRYVNILSPAKNAIKNNVFDNNLFKFKRKGSLMFLRPDENGEVPPGECKIGARYRLILKDLGERGIIPQDENYYYIAVYRIPTSRLDNVRVLKVHKKNGFLPAYYHNAIVMNASETILRQESDYDIDEVMSIFDFSQKQLNMFQKHENELGEIDLEEIKAEIEKDRILAGDEKEPEDVFKPGTTNKIVDRFKRSLFAVGEIQNALSVYKFMLDNNLHVGINIITEQDERGFKRRRAVSQFFNAGKYDESKFEYIIKPEKDMKEIQGISAKFLQAAVDNAKHDILDDMGYNLPNLNFQFYSLIKDGEKIVSDNPMADLQKDGFLVYNAFYSKRIVENKNKGEQFINPISAFRYLLAATSANKSDYNEFLKILTMYQNYLRNVGLDLGNSALEKIYTKIDPYQLEIHDSKKTTSVPEENVIDLDVIRRVHRKTLFKLFGINERSGMFSNVKKYLKDGVLPTTTAKELINRLSYILIKEKESMGINPINRVKLSKKEGKGKDSYEILGAVRVNEMRKLNEWIDNQSPEIAKRLRYLRDFIGLTYNTRLFMRKEYNFTASDFSNFIGTTLFKRFGNHIQETSLYKKMIETEDDKRPSDKKLSQTNKFIDRNINFVSSVNQEGTTQSSADPLFIHWFVGGKLGNKNLKERSTLEKYFTIFNMEYEKTVNQNSMLKDINSIKELDELLENKLDESNNALLEKLIEFGERVLSLSETKKFFNMDNIKKSGIIYSISPDMLALMFGLGMVGSIYTANKIQKIRAKSLAKKIIEGRAVSNKRKLSKNKRKRLEKVLTELHSIFTEFSGSADKAERHLKENFLPTVRRNEGLPDEFNSWVSADFDLYIRRLEEIAVTYNNRIYQRKANAMKPTSTVFRSSSPLLQKAFNDLNEIQRVSAKYAKEFEQSFETVNQYLETTLYKDSGRRVIEAYSNLQSDLVGILSEIYLLISEANEKPIKKLKLKAQDLINKIKTMETINPEINKAKRFFEAFENGLFDTKETTPNEFSDKNYEALVNHLKIYAKKIYNIDKFVYDKYTKVLMDKINKLKLARAEYIDLTRKPKISFVDFVNNDIKEQESMAPSEIENYIPRFLWNFPIEEMLEMEDYYSFNSGGLLLTGRDVVTKPSFMKYYKERTNKTGMGFINDVIKYAGLSIPSSILKGQNYQLDSLFRIRSINSINNFENNSMKAIFREVFDKFDNKKDPYHDAHEHLKKLVTTKFFALLNNPLQKELTKLFLELDNIDLRDFNGSPKKYKSWKENLIKDYLTPNIIRKKYIYSNLNTALSSIGTGLMIGGKFSSAILQLTQIVTKYVDNEINIDISRISQKGITKNFTIGIQGDINIDGKVKNIFSDLGKEFDEIIIKGELGELRKPADIVRDKIIDSNVRKDFDNFQNMIGTLLLSATGEFANISRNIADNLLTKTPFIGQIMGAVGLNEKASEKYSFGYMERKSRQIVAKEVFSNRFSILLHDGVPPKEAYKLAINFTGKKIDDVMYMFNMLNKPGYLSGNLRSVFLFQSFMVYFGDMAYKAVKVAVRSGMMKDFTLSDFKSLMSLGSMTIGLWLLYRLGFNNILQFSPAGMLINKATDVTNFLIGLYYWQKNDISKRDKVWDKIGYGQGIKALPGIFFTMLVPETMMLMEAVFGRLYNNETEYNKKTGKSLKSLRYKYAGGLANLGMDTWETYLYWDRAKIDNLDGQFIPEFTSEAMLKTFNTLSKNSVGFSMNADPDKYKLFKMWKQKDPETLRKYMQYENKKFWDRKR